MCFDAEINMSHSEQILLILRANAFPYLLYLITFCLFCKALFFSSSSWGDRQREAAASVSDKWSNSQWTFPCKQRISDGIDSPFSSGNLYAWMTHTAVFQEKILNKLIQDCLTLNWPPPFTYQCAGNRLSWNPCVRQLWTGVETLYSICCCCHQYG